MLRRAIARHRRRIIFWSIVLSLLLLVWASLTQPVLVLGKNKHIPAVSSQLLESRVRVLSELFVPRNSDHTDNLDQVAAFIKQEFGKAGGRVREQKYSADRRVYRNVIAQFGPEGDKRVVVGAHYDAFGEMPAADDNASGVAVLIELAYLLNKTPPKKCVELVAYALEEPPYFSSDQMGSAIHAANLKQRGITVSLMLSLESVGYFSDAKGSQHFPFPISLFYPRRGDFIAVVGRTQESWVLRRVKKAMIAGCSLPVRSVNVPSWFPGVDESDQVSYWRCGYPGLMITDTAYFRNRNYHTGKDTADTLDYRRMAMVVQGVYAAVKETAR